MPSLFGIKINSIKLIIREIILNILLLILWGNYLQYPLSDFSAAVCLTAAAVLLKRMSEKNDSRFKNIFISLGIGILLYASYNIRAAYLYGAGALMVIYIILANKKKVAFSLLGILIGVGIIATPQIIINHQYVGTFSPKVYTEQINNYEKSLQMQQVFWGLGYEKYETYIGDPDYYEDAKVYYDDVAGTELIRREKLSREEFSFEDWAKLVCKYPMDMIALYTRHLVGLITPVYNKRMFKTCMHQKVCCA